MCSIDIKLYNKFYPFEILQIGTNFTTIHQTSFPVLFITLNISINYTQVFLTSAHSILFHLNSACILRIATKHGLTQNIKKNDRSSRTLHKLKNRNIMELILLISWLQWFIIDVYTYWTYPKKKIKQIPLVITLSNPEA